MEFIPAATLGTLTILRLPAALDPNRGSVFRATILAAVACTLYLPPRDGGLVQDIVKYIRVDSDRALLAG